MNQLQVSPCAVADVIHLADAIGKMRQLTEDESMILERAIRSTERAERMKAVSARSMSERPIRRWARDDDRELLRLIKRREVARMIAKKLGRTPTAIYRRAQVLGISLRKGAVL